MSNWIAAFARAKAIEAVGAQDFADFFNPSSVPSSSSFSSSLPTAAEDDLEASGRGDDELGGGGFRQPRGLAQFSRQLLVKKDLQKSGKSVVGSTKGRKVTDGEKVDSPAPLCCWDSNERGSSSGGGGMARQICRQWLKNSYLSIGKACGAGDGCPRLHVITGNPMLLYKDFSFKGLPQSSKNTILEAVKKEQEAAAKSSSVNVFSSSSLSSSSTIVDTVGEESRSLKKRKSKHEHEAVEEVTEETEACKEKKKKKHK